MSRAGGVAGSQAAGQEGGALATRPGEFPLHLQDGWESFPKCCQSNRHFLSEGLKTPLKTRKGKREIRTLVSVILKNSVISASGVDKLDLTAGSVFSLHLWLVIPI